MERLQAALDRARARRGTARPAGPAPRRGRAAATEEAWAALAEIEVRPRRLAQRRLIAGIGGRDGAATAFDILRTKLLQLTAAHDWRRIVVTSPAPGAGKTTVAANLSLALARQSDLRVLLLDLDLRRPALGGLLGVQPEHTMAAVLEGRAPFEATARRMGANLAFGLNAGPADYPSDLFLRRATAETIDAIEARFRPDVLLFDMPPAMVNDDTSAFLGNVDCALIVAEAGVSTVAQVDVCEKELAEQTEILGVVLNKCAHGFGRDGYYDYGKAY